MLFITATDTDVGKTFFSKSLIKYLIENKIFSKEELAYFKPVQCGSPTDFDEIKTETGVDIFCTYNLSYPASPDYASSLENIKISLEKIKSDFKELQAKYKYIVVEGAGGAAVPINNQEYVSDLIKSLDLETVLITRPDLGTINHTLLTVEHLKNKAINIKGLYVSARSRDLSKGYDVTVEEKSKQDSAALKTILKFTELEKLELNDFKTRTTAINN